MGLSEGGSPSSETVNSSSSRTPTNMTPEQFQIALAANRAQLAGYAGLAAALVALLKREAK